MEPGHAVKKVVAWGNSYGIRLTKAELASLGIAPGAEVEVEVRPVRRKIDWSKVAIFHWGGNASEEHDEILYQGWLAEEQEKEARLRGRKKAGARPKGGGP